MLEISNFIQLDIMMIRKRDGLLDYIFCRFGSGSSLTIASAKEEDAT